MDVREVKAITNILSEFKVPCRVLPPPVSYQTPRSNVYVLERGAGIKESRIIEYETEIESALGRIYGEQVGTRFLSSPLAISVPRRDPQNVPIYPLLRKVKRNEPGQLLIATGEHYNHAGSVRGNGVVPQILQLDLMTPSTSHMLIAGTTGAGKTGVLKNIILSGALASSPADVSWLIFDPKRRDFPILEGLPHLAAPIFLSPESIAGGLRGLVEEMKVRGERFDAMVAKVGVHQATVDADKIFRPRIVAVIDEVAELVDQLGKEAEGWIKRLLQIGRGLGIHLILGTQKPEADFISGISMANLSVRACGAVSQLEHGKYATGIPGKKLGAHKLTGKGDFLLTINATKVFPFQSGHIEAGEEIKIIGGIDSRWQGQRSKWQLRWQPVEAAGSAAQSQGNQAKRRQVDPVHEEMVGELLAYAQQAGALPSPYKTAKIFKEKHGRTLNPNTANMLVERAQQRLM